MISVIVSLYNAQSYIANCLDSILAQDMEPFDIEVIVVNDGSTDDSEKIVQQYAALDERIKLINQSNGGLSRARNTGLKHVSGDYVLFVDADDELADGALKRLVNAIEKDDADAAVGSIEVIYETHQEMRESDTWYYTIRQEGTLPVDGALLDDFHCSACAVLFRKSIIDCNSLQFPDGLLYEDACWHWEYFTCCRKIAFVKEPVYTYWRHAESIMSSTFEQKPGVAIQHLYVAEKIFEFWKKRGEFARYKQISLKLLEAYFWFAFNYSQGFEKPRAAYECARIIRRFDLDVGGCENLCRISHGDLNFLFPSKYDLLSDQDRCNFDRYMRLRGVCDQLLPQGSSRRQCVHFIARCGWKLLLRLTSRTTS